MTTRGQTKHQMRKSRPRSELRAISTPGRPYATGLADTDVDLSVPLTSSSSLRVHLPAESSPRYRILGSIHRGGMGEILLAKVEGPEGFSRKVVLKGLLSRLSEDDVSYRLFMREARLMSHIDHPNVVRVFDLATIKGRPYLAMEYMRGRNFHQVIQRAAVKTKGVPLRIALAVVSQALRGLHYAHALKDEQGSHLGVIHRDVSPGNLLVSFFGEVKVTDFGIAKLADSPRYTGPRSIRGKARYVAPEQIHGENATVLSDVYSAGVVLAEALIGEPLWERSTIPETLLAIVTDDRGEVIDRVIDRYSDVPGLRAALRGSLSLNPSDRLTSALQFAEVLESISASLGKPVSAVEMGLYLRDLFKDAPDVPRGDGFGLSGLPIPQFAMGDEDSATNSTVIQLEPDWLSAQAATGPTIRMRPDAPRSVPPPPPPPVTPVPGDAAAFPLEPMGGDSVGDADTHIKDCCALPVPQIRAQALPSAAAIVRDPAESEREAWPLPTPRAVGPLSSTIDGMVSQKSMAVLLGGIFIGAGLATVGCVIALLMG